MIEQAIQARKPVLDGPLVLVQGGQGLIYRTPIYVGGGFKAISLIRQFSALGMLETAK